MLKSGRVPSLSVATVQVTEGRSARFTFVLDRPASDAISFTWTTSPGSASAPADFSPQSGAVTFSGGATSVSIDVPTIDDFLYEGDETFEIEITQVRNANLGAGGDSARIEAVIVDNDAPPSISMTDVMVIEGATASVPVSLSAISGRDTLVHYTTSPGSADASDFTAASGTLTIPAGSLSGVITIPTTADSSVESDETFQLTLSAPMNAALADATAVITITDASPVPSLAINDVTIGEGGATATFTVTMSGASSSAVTFDWTTQDGSATAGSDYTVSSGTSVSIPALSTTATLTVPITQDAVSCEGSETFSIVLSNASGATISDNTGIGTITDDDKVSMSIADVNVIEGVAADFVVSVTPQCSQAITFDWATSNGTALAGTHYTTSSATGVTLPANTSSVTVQVPTLVAGISSSKTFTVNLSNATSAYANVTDATGSGLIAVPALDLDMTSSLPAALSFDRASMATYFDNQRVLKTALANHSRIDHDPVTGKPLGLLIEESRTNYALNSADASLFPNNAVTVANDVATAPDGTFNADLVTANTSAALHQIYDRSAGTGGAIKSNETAVLSLFVKAANSVSDLDLSIKDQTNGAHGAGASINLGTLTLSSPNQSGNGVLDGSGVQPVGNGWYRVWIAVRANPASATHDIRPTISLCNNISATCNNAGAGEAAYVWGVQLEKGTSITSYIPTGSTAVTRAAETVNTTSVAWYDLSQGTYLAKAHLTSLVPSAHQVLFNQTDSAGNEAISARRDSNTEVAYYVQTGNVVQASDSSMGVWSAGETKAVAVAAAQNSFAAAVNGTVTSTDTSGNMPTAIDYLRLGRAQTTGYLNGHLSQLKYYPYRLSNASLQALSAADNRPVLYVEDATTNEGGSLTFTVKLSQALSPAAALAVSWTASSGTATLGTDTSGATSGTVTIPSGGTSATFTISTSDDTVIEDNETLSVALSGYPATAAAGDINATGTIVDAPLNLNFMNYPTASGLSVPGGFTYARSSVGTYTDSSGVMKASTANVVLWSERFATVPWMTARANVIPDVSGTAAPDGTFTADLLVEDTTATDTHDVAQASLPIVANTLYTFSVYAKSAGRSIRLHLFDDPANGGCIAPFNLSTGAVAAAASLSGTGASSPSSSIVSVGNGWYRLSVTCNVSATATFADAGVYLIANGATTAIYSGDGTSGVYIWGAQLEKGAAVTPYIPTAGAINYAPRYNYDPGTCSDGTLESANPGCTRKPLGLLLETGRDNVAWPSEQFDNARWSKTAMTIGADTSETTDPMGTNNADKLIESASTGFHYLTHATGASISAGAFVSYSVYVKRPASNPRRYVRLVLDDANGSGGFNGEFDLQLGAAYNLSTGAPATGGYTSIKPVGNGWYRIAVAGVLSSGVAAPRVGIEPLNASNSSNFAGDGVTSIYAWGAQVEQGAIPTSYIPTATATVSRSIDRLYSNNIVPWYQAGGWTMLTDFSRPHYETINAIEWSMFFQFFLLATGDQDRITAYFDSQNNYFASDVYSTNVHRGTSIGAGNPVGDQLYQMGVVYTGANIRSINDGTLGPTQAVSPAPSVDSLAIGGDDSGWGAVDGHIRKIQYIPRVLSDPQLTTFTTD